MIRSSSIAIELLIGFYVSHQVKIILRELWGDWAGEGRHYVFVTVRTVNHVIILLVSLCNITPT